MATRKMPRKKAETPLPQVIVPLESCTDKKIKEEWTEKRARDLANFPSPFRMLLLGPPGVGKSTLMKHIVVHQRPRFQEVYVIHEDHSEDPDAPGTSEYDDLDATRMLSEVPDLKYWNERCADDDPDKPVKRLVILDDLEMEGAERLRNLQTLFRYVSSHKGFSLAMAHQSFFSLEPVIKKVSNIFLIWLPKDRDEIGRIEKRVGLDKGVLKALFATLAKDERDFITVDHTRHSPAPLRLGFWDPVQLS